MKAFWIDWDLDEWEKVAAELPDEIEIPDGMTDEEDISDYISNQVGFCHKSYAMAKFSPKDIEEIIRDYVDMTLHQHDMNANKNEKHKRIANKIIATCIDTINEDKDLIFAFENVRQIEYFVRQNILYMLDSF